MPPDRKERWMNMFMLVCGIAAAALLLDQAVPVGLRILPWLLIFGYPVWRMFRHRGTNRGD